MLEQRRRHSAQRAKPRLLLWVPVGPKPNLSLRPQIELVQKELKLMNAEDAATRSLALPALQPLAKAAAGRFDTTYLDQDVRVSRGRFGELRVFQREA
ncbi:unnamed protein product [Ectocarpus sp. 13 AM-2016]